ncbi:MAG: 30S ribosomal protein S11 [Phaeodactylibacter sp.]|nr:30S ribosomal protein S11 [Phaeodactylibacter sp.]MCB9266820.1 30S ribosomal protein S11 [Lewinellaceae bacterium]MCB9287896.1 30S ribosomal protein S11 [Lewinellaceae bacterium]
MAKGRSSKQKKVKKRNIRVDAEGMAYIKATFNNIIISLTNKKGQVISWSSAGKAGFRGSKKNTPYAAQIAASEASRIAYDAGLRTAEVFVKGPGSGREAAIRAIDVAGIKVTRIKDVTPVPHNGCRPPKRRRV